MTFTQLLGALLLTVTGYAAFILTRLHDARTARNVEAAEANYWHAKADTEHHKADRLGQELIAALAAVQVAQSRQVAAAKHAADMQAQRDNMQRQLARQTWPVGGTHG